VGINKKWLSVEVILDEDQRDYLTRLANKTGKDLSELAHQLLDERIQQIKEEQLNRTARELRAAFEVKGVLTEFSGLGNEDKPEKRNAGGRMTHSERILSAVKYLTKGDSQMEFSRNDVRLHLGISSHDWLNGYTAIFQAMRSDHPGAAPPIAEKYQGVFRRVRRGSFVLTPKGKSLIFA